jgi:phosphoglycerate dehydrogenase-like enzyme
MTIKILLTAPYMIPFVDRFKPVFDRYGLELIIPDVSERMEEEDLLAYAGKFDGTICGDDRYTQRVIDACLPCLKVISKWGTGIDSIDKKYANQQGVMVGNTPRAFTHPVADSVMGYMLSFLRNIPAMDKTMKAGEWNKISGKALNETVLGVVGVGDIGKAVLRRAKPFGMKLLGNDIIEIDPNFIAETGVEMVGLDELLGKADVVSLNCDLNPTSKHIMNAENIAKMKASAVLINTARGEIVDETALIHALQNGQIAGVGMDVFEHEPLPENSPLKQMDNVLLAPHNSNSSPAAWENVHWNTIRNLLIGLGIDSEGLRDE